MTEQELINILKELPDMSEYLEIVKGNRCEVKRNKEI